MANRSKSCGEICIDEFIWVWSKSFVAFPPFVVIEELKGEKIDIFEWSDNVSELIKNALSPAQVLAVLPMEETKNLLVVVENDQLSLAIGKKGQNARLAVQASGWKIDIKAESVYLENLEG